MISRKSQFSSVRAWPFTPEPSPPLLPQDPVFAVNEYFSMAAEEKHRSRPISIGPRREGTLSPMGRPTLQDVLNNKAPPPYTLAAYTAFLSQQHCLETLEFTMEAKRYSDKYDEAAASIAGMPLTVETSEGFELQQDWLRLLDVYVKPGAPREINLPSEERDDLVICSYDPRPPRPEALEPSVKRMYDLMSDSIFIPFCESVKPMVHAHTYGAVGDLQYMDDTRLSSDIPGMHRRQHSRRRRSPPSTSAPLEQSRSHQHRPAGSSGASNPLSGGSGPRLTQPLSNTSAYSESVMTDDSGSGESPMAGDFEAVVTPPTTPPMSDMPMQLPQRSSVASVVVPKQPLRTDSSGWKKMTKLFGGNKKRGSHSSQSKDEPL